MLFRKTTVRFAAIILGMAVVPAMGQLYSEDVAIVGSTSVMHGGNFPTSGGSFDVFSFELLAVGDVNAVNLAAFDTVLLNVGSPQMDCSTGSLTSGQKTDLVDFVSAGGKLIISDSECPSADYSWLPYPFTTNNPGAMGEQGTLFIAEENVLSTSDPSDAYYIDAATLGSSTDAVGDMNVMTTYDPNWCLDMSGTNATPVTGPVHTYARYGNGLMIYNGLDMDVLGGSDPDYGLAEIWLQELQAAFNPSPLADLPCGITVVGIALTPLEAENEVGEEHTVTATVTDVGGVPQAGFLVTFTVLSGPNAGATGTCDPADCTSDANGQVTFTYTGSGGVGTDEIVACLPHDMREEICSQVVTKTWVITNLPPVALCQDVFVAADGNHEGHAAPEDVDNGSSDPNGDPITFSLDPPGPYPLGTTIVTRTVTDNGSPPLSDTCTATVTVVDGSDTPPTSACPDTITVQATDAAGIVVEFSTPAAHHGSNPVVTVNPASGSVFPVGTTTVTVTVTDDAGASAFLHV